jgi:hypothetical protein
MAIMQLYCPACGEVSVLDIPAFLIEPDADILLACGHCDTRWAIQCKYREYKPEEEGGE